MGIGNLIRFPYVAYHNGGGAFLFPYFVMYLFVGIPIMYLEVSIGQYSKLGAHKVTNTSFLFMEVYTMQLLFWGFFFQKLFETNLNFRQQKVKLELPPS